MNPHSNLASFYRQVYLEDELPNNLCNYFWAIIFGIITLPFTWLILLFNYSKGYIKKYQLENTDGITQYYYAVHCQSLPTRYGFMGTIAIWMLGALTVVFISILTGHQPKEFTNALTIPMLIISVYLIGIASLFTCIGLFMSAIAIWRLIPKKPVKEETEQERKMREFNEKLNAVRQRDPNIFTLAWRWLVAFKEKNCPLITWDYSKEK
jgi:hypothetical protein